MRGLQPACPPPGWSLGRSPLQSSATAAATALAPLVGNDSRAVLLPGVGVRQVPGCAERLHPTHAPRAPSWPPPPARGDASEPGRVPFAAGSRGRRTRNPAPLAQPGRHPARSGIVFPLTCPSVVRKARQCRGIWKPPKFPCAAENLCPARRRGAVARVSPLCPLPGWPLAIAAGSPRALAWHRPCPPGHSRGAGCPNTLRPR